MRVWTVEGSAAVSGCAKLPIGGVDVGRYRQQLVMLSEAVLPLHCWETRQ